MKTVIPAASLLLLLGACEKTPPTGEQEPQEASSEPAAESATAAPETMPESRKEWGPIQKSALNDVQQAQLDKASSAQKALGKQLLGGLTTSIAERGVADSVEFCRGAAPDIASKVSTEYGVQIGRTSHRLRNPANAPPDWAEQAVESREAGPHYFAGPKGTFGVMMPISTAEMCTDCHGPAEALAEGVPEALAEQYPRDQATGFEAGQLRGWFWVEVGGPS